MKSIVIFIFVTVLGSSAFAQSAREYVELVCGSKATLQSVYSTDPIEDVLGSKTREIEFWKGHMEATLQTVEILDKGGMDAIKLKENLPTTIAVIKACTAYFQIESDVKSFLEKNGGKCLDADEKEFDIENVGRTCNLLKDPGTPA